MHKNLMIDKILKYFLQYGEIKSLKIQHFMSYKITKLDMASTPTSKKSPPPKS